jgi:signal transduction histidine kinase
MSAMQQEKIVALPASNCGIDPQLAMFVHDIRGPLGAIEMLLAAMRRSDSDAFAEERRIIQAQVRHMAGLVDGLRGASRIAPDSIKPPKREPVAIDEIVAEAIDIAKPMIDEHEQTVRTAIARDLMVNGEPRRLVQVVVNLLTNAAKYSPARRTIWVSARAEDGKAVLRVRDKGIGIEPDFLPHVFNLFSQGAWPIDRSKGGSGLGLAIVHKVVSLHGGEVDVYSQGRGRGSEFVVRLPLLVQETGDSPPPGIWAY